MSSGAGAGEETAGFGSGVLGVLLLLWQPTQDSRASVDVANAVKVSRLSVFIMDQSNDVGSPALHSKVDRDLGHCGSTPGRQDLQAGSCPAAWVDQRRHTGNKKAAVYTAAWRDLAPVFPMEAYAPCFARSTTLGHV